MMEVMDPYMAEMIRTELGVQRESVLLMGVILPDGNADPHDPLGELRSLVKTAGGQVVDEMVCKRDKPHPGLYVGSGKAEEIAQRAEMNQVDTVIFDNDLTPGQVRDLEQIIRRKIVDRSELILDIFAAHARTRESRVQVELAQLEYTYPRLKNMWSHLERIGAGAGAGIGTRGPGEKQIETDRRLVQKRVSQLKRQLEQIDKRKIRAIRSRNDAYCACLVGYTNAGKSTMMNLLTGADTLVADKLFATLATKTRQWRLTGGEQVLLSDTVGFVRDLPHHLVASFRSTLEEAIHADLLIHVADASHERVAEEIQAVRSVLGELECLDRDRLLVLNKVDKILDPSIRTVLANQYPEALFVSARTGEGTEELVEAVTQRAVGHSVRVTLSANFRNGRLMHYIQQYAEVQSEEYDNQAATIEAILPSARVEELLSFGKDVAILQEQPTV
jgi:GTP-binding protein HflX